MDKEKIKEKIRPLYSELQQYLSFAPGENSNYIHGEIAKRISNQLNKTIDELNVASGKNYDKFKIETTITTGNFNKTELTIITLDYRTKLSGLIGNIQGEFFSEEKMLPTGPNTVINTSQTQIQNQQQSVVVDIAMIIAEKRAEYKPGTPERNFLDKLSGTLKTAKSVQEIIQNIISIAIATGVGLKFLKKFFGA